MRSAVASSALVLVALAAACGSGAATEAGYATTSEPPAETAGSGGAAGSAGASGATAGTGGGGSAGSAGMKGGPPYPVVLCHGFFGFQDFAGVDFVTYFYDVKKHLAEKGETAIYTPAVDPFNSSQYRGAELYEKVKEILAETGAAKVNLVGHSQGGLDARVVAHDHPEIVASVTTIATPHQGTPISDVALGILSDPNAQKLIDEIVKAVSIPLYDAAGQPTSLFKALQQFSHDGIASFNAIYTDRPGITYQSFTGRSSLHDGNPDCVAPMAPPFVSKWNDTKDPIEPLLSISALILNGSGQGAPFANDGLVRAKDAHWGTFLGCVPADHFDEIGQLFGDSPGLGNDWDYLQFYVDLVAMLRVQGF